MGIRYDNDVVAWAFEQAALLRSGTWSDLGIEHLAEEVEDVARSEQRELASRLLYDDEWLADVWNDAVRQAAEQTGLEQFPENGPWSMDQVLDEKFVPE